MDKNITIHNDFNFIGLKNFKEIELNLFFYIVKQISDKNDLEIKIKFGNLSNILKSNSSKKTKHRYFIKGFIFKITKFGNKNVYKKWMETNSIIQTI